MVNLMHHMSGAMELSLSDTANLPKRIRLIGNGSYLTGQSIQRGSKI